MTLHFFVSIEGFLRPFQVGSGVVVVSLLAVFFFCLFSSSVCRFSLFFSVLVVLDQIDLK